MEKKSTTIHEKNSWDVGREIRVVLKIYFNWKHSPFHFYKDQQSLLQEKYENCIETGLSDQK